MAGRVNTKFVFILSAVLCVSVLGFAAAAYHFNNRDYETFLIRGRELLAQGEYKDAVENFERAALRSKSDIPTIQEYLEALKLLPAADYIEAQNNLRAIRENTRHLTDIDPDSDELFQDFVDLIKGYVLVLGQDQDTTTMWIQQTAQGRLELNPDDGLARRYAGIYGLNLMSADQAVQEIHKVRDDLEWAHQHYPQDTDVMRSLANWKLIEAKRQDRSGGDADLGERLRQEAIALNEQFLASDPDDPRLMLEYLQVLLNATSDPQAEDPYEAIKPMLDKLELKLLADPQPSDVVRTVVQYLKVIYAKDIAEDAPGDAVVISEGLRRAVALLHAGINANPEDPTYRLLLGKELKLQGKYEEARGYIQAVRELSTQGQYVQVLRNHKLRLSASVESVDLLMLLADQSGPGPERDDLLSQAQQVLDDVSAAGLDGSPRVLLLKGKLALVQGRVREGLVNIDKATDLYDNVSRERAEALLLSAQARSKQGDWGAAAERYEQLLAMNPSIPSIRLQLASTYLRGQQFDKAQTHIDAVLEDDPENEQAMVIQASLLARLDQLDEAIAIYQQLDMNNRPDLAVSLAQLLIQGDRKAQAGQIIKKYFDADPSNIQMLALLLDTEESEERKSELVAMSRDAGADPKILAMIEQQRVSDGQIDPEQLIETLLEGQTDPFQRAIGGASLYTRAGKPDKARELLDEAARIKPDDKAVIDMRFEFAITDGDLDEAQRMADLAAQMNLDDASGRFYLAQLQAARKQYAQAIDTLRLALEDIPINSEGWRLLGDALAETSDYNEAIAAFEKALEQRPDNLGALRGLAAIRDRQGRHEEALLMIKMAFHQNQQNSKLRQLYLAYESRYGDKLVALKLRRDMVKLQPSHTENRRALAMLLAEMKQPDEALDTIQSVIDSEGMTPSNVLVLSRIHRELGDVPRGAQVIRSYIAELGSKVQAYDHLILGRYLMEVGDSKGALSAYTQAIALESGQRRASRELADLYFRRGAYDQAVPLYRDLYEQFPEDVGLGLRLSDALVKIQEFDEASQFLSGLGDSAGSSSDALRALIAEHEGRHDDALRLVSSAIEADPGKAVLYYERAAIFSQDLDRLSDAMLDLNSALSLDPDHLLSRRLMVGLYVKQGQRNEAIRELRTMVSRHPEYGEGRLLLIKMLTADGELTSAKLLTRAAIDLAPQEPGWHTVMAGLAVQSKQPLDAIDSYATVLELSPTPNNLLNLVSLQIKNGRAEDALSALREHAEMVNPQPVLQAAVGRALLASGKVEQGNQVCSRALERCVNLGHLMMVIGQLRQDLSTDQIKALLEGLANPPSPLWVGLALAQLEVERSNYESAAEQLMALEPLISPEDEQAQKFYDLALAISLHHSGKPEQALPIYQRIRETQPDNTSVLNNMAYMLAEDMGQADQALPLAQHAAELDPDNAQILDTLGWVQFKLGQTDQARTTLEGSIAVQPLSANHLHLAWVLKEQGYKAQARRHLKTAADLAEQNNETDILQEIKDLLEQIDQLTEASLSS